MNNSIQSGISRIDLHVHSCYSRSAGDWLLQQLKSNECYTTPREAYELAIRKGMDYVTLTDHDTIDGCKELAHLPNFIISEEITTLIPESGVRLHVVALNITEAIHLEVQRLKFNVYELVEYLHTNNIVHFIAHPFFRMGESLSIDDFEKMLLLFRVFEVKNGGKKIYPDDLLIRVLKNLSPEYIWRLAEKHNREPIGEYPWKKSMVAGSDDHGGLLIGHPHTVCPKSATVQELLQNIIQGKSHAEGLGGSLLSVAHSIFTVSYRHLRNHKDSFVPINNSIIWNLLGQLFDTGNIDRSLNWSAKVGLFLNDHFDLLNSGKARESSRLFFRKHLLERLRKDKDLRTFLTNSFDYSHSNSEKLFHIIDRLANQVIADFVSKLKFYPNVNVFDLIKKLKQLSALIPLLAPYIIACKTEHRDRPLMRKVFSEHFPHIYQKFHQSILVICNRPAQQAIRELEKHNFLNNGYDHHLTFWGMDHTGANENNYVNFQAIAYINMSEKKEKRMAIPSLLQVARELSDGDFSEIHFLDYGSLTFIVYALALWMGIKMTARYPYKIIKEKLQFEDRNKSKMVVALLKWFFSKVDKIYVASAEAKEHALLLGLPESKIVSAGTVEQSEQAMIENISGRTENRFRKAKSFV